MGDGEQISMWWILRVWVQARGRVLKIFAGMLSALLAVALLLPRTYTITSSFVPQTQQDPSRAGLASLAGQFGLALGSVAGQAQSPQLYADLLRTGEVLQAVALERVQLDAVDPRKVPLSQFLRISGDDSSVVLEKTIEALRNKIVSASAATRTTGVVTLTVQTKSPLVSIQISDRLLAAVNDFNLKRRQSQASAERQFVAARLAESKDSLSLAELALQEFQRKNRDIQSSPDLALLRQRLQREIDLRQQVTTGLAQQYEDSRIREVRDTPVITVLERPQLPARPDSRGLTRKAISGAVVAFVLALGWVLVVEMLRQWLGGAEPTFARMRQELAALDDAQNVRPR